MDEKQVFLEALELDSAEQREEFLDRACGNDAEFRKRIEVLLQSHAQGDERLKNPHIPADAVQSDPTGDDVSLDFLSPSSQTDSLGRLDS